MEIKSIQWEVKFIKNKQKLEEILHKTDKYDKNKKTLCKEKKNLSNILTVNIKRRNSENGDLINSDNYIIKNVK
jgi:hypothetical protein